MRLLRPTGWPCRTASSPITGSPGSLLVERELSRASDHRHMDGRTGLVNELAAAARLAGDGVEHQTGADEQAWGDAQDCHRGSCEPSGHGVSPKFSKRANAPNHRLPVLNT